MGQWPGFGLLWGLLRGSQEPLELVETPGSSAGSAQWFGPRLPYDNPQLAHLKAWPLEVLPCAPAVPAGIQQGQIPVTAWPSLSLQYSREPTAYRY